MKLKRFLVAAGVSWLLAAGLVAAPSDFTPVPAANTRTPGIGAPNLLPPELFESVVAQGSIKLENPAPAGVTPAGCPGSASVGISYYGYNDDGTMLPNPADI